MKKCECGGKYKLSITTYYHKVKRKVKLYVCDKCYKDIRVESFKK